MEDDRAPSRGSSIYSDEPVDFEELDALIAELNDELDEQNDNYDNDYNDDNDNNDEELEWDIENGEEGNNIPNAELEEEPMEPDSTTDWVPPPIRLRAGDEFKGPADSSSWWRND